MKGAVAVGRVEGEGRLYGHAQLWSREPVRGNYQASPSRLPQHTPHCYPLSCFSRPCWIKRGFWTMDDEPSFLFLSNLLGFLENKNSIARAGLLWGNLNEAPGYRQLCLHFPLPGHVMIPESCHHLSFP